MDYSELSDQAISLAVAAALGRKMEPAWVDGKPFAQEEHDNGWISMHDFCNNPDDAWPIIAEHEINILWNWNEEGLHGATASPLYEYEHENALRAAMTVFLMKHGYQHVPTNSTGSDIR